MPPWARLRSNQRRSLQRAAAGARTAASRARLARLVVAAVWRASWTSRQRSLTTRARSAPTARTVTLKTAAMRTRRAPGTRLQWCLTPMRRRPSRGGGGQAGLLAAAQQNADGLLPAPDAGAPERRRCSACRALGHNRRSCPLLNGGVPPTEGEVVTARAVPLLMQAATTPRLPLPLSVVPQGAVAALLHAAVAAGMASCALCRHRLWTIWASRRRQSRASLCTSRWP